MFNSSISAPFRFDDVTEPYPFGNFSDFKVWRAVCLVFQASAGDCPSFYINVGLRIAVGLLSRGRNPASLQLTYCVLTAGSLNLGSTSNSVIVCIHGDVLLVTFIRTNTF